MNTLRTPAVLPISVANSPALLRAAWAMLAAITIRHVECAHAQPIVTVMQESGPGVGDFSANILGNVVAWTSVLTPSEFYNFRNCRYQGGVITPLEGRVQTFFGDTSRGLALFQQHDSPGGGGARAECRVRVAPPQAGDTWHAFAPGWSWHSCGNSSFSRVDWDMGASVGCDFGFDRFPFVGSWTVDVQFTQQLSLCSSDPTDAGTPPIQGLFDWVIRSASGPSIVVALEESRRVRFVPCNAPSISGDLDVNVGQTATFVITPGGNGPFTYQWRKDLANIPGATDRVLTIISVVCGDAGVYDCVVSNSCGTVTTRGARLSTCRIDFNCDGFATGDDFDAFVIEFVAGNTTADFNGDGFVTGDDFDAFVIEFLRGC